MTAGLRLPCAEIPVRSVSMDTPPESAATPMMTTQPLDDRSILSEIESVESTLNSFLSTQLQLQAVGQQGFSQDNAASVPSMPKHSTYSKDPASLQGWNTSSFGMYEQPATDGAMPMWFAPNLAKGCSALPKSWFLPPGSKLVTNDKDSDSSGLDIDLFLLRGEKDNLEANLKVAHREQKSLRDRCAALEERCVELESRADPSIRFSDVDSLLSEAQAEADNDYLKVIQRACSAVDAMSNVLYAAGVEGRECVPQVVEKTAASEDAQRLELGLRRLASQQQDAVSMYELREQQLALAQRELSRVYQSETTVADVRDRTAEVHAQATARLTNERMLLLADSDKLRADLSTCTVEYNTALEKLDHERNVSMDLATQLEQSERQRTAEEEKNARLQEELDALRRHCLLQMETIKQQRDCLDGAWSASTETKTLRLKDLEKQDSLQQDDKKPLQLKDDVEPLQLKDNIIEDRVSKVTQAHLVAGPKELPGVGKYASFSLDAVTDIDHAPQTTDSPNYHSAEAEKVEELSKEPPKPVGILAPSRRHSSPARSKFSSPPAFTSIPARMPNPESHSQLNFRPVEVQKDVNQLAFVPAGAGWPLAAPAGVIQSPPIEAISQTTQSVISSPHLLANVAGKSEAPIMKEQISLPDMGADGHFASHPGSHMIAAVSSSQAPQNSLANTARRNLAQMGTASTEAGIEDEVAELCRRIEEDSADLCGNFGVSQDLPAISPEVSARDSRLPTIPEGSEIRSPSPGADVDSKQGDNRVPFTGLLVRKFHTN
eukprot:gnl/MRDRNA2_/MRDRNA2_28338_c0_seq1.p1 gnl/MRDRNA2_/MRDRNA2_28338_c0~~gnl/MRDRNA2_/MRDRNA2_28338_c0_seq1.p1  ORF type:complete len:776 (+),score=164.14 gnl/MRDRNA2_/MRDRNA2_28338_c0_seq1:67-2394(+)